MSNFNKKSLGPAILNYEKSKNEILMGKEYELDEFALVNNLKTNEEMIAFTVTEFPEKYFWASTALNNFISDNVDIGIFDDDRLTYKFEHKVFITYGGKKTLKSDETKQCNIWKINF